MASSPIAAWQMKGEKVEVVTDFLFLGSKSPVDCDCSHEIRRQWLLGRKAMTNVDRVLKNRDITLPTKVHIVKAVVFPVIMYGCESWTVKAEHQRIDAFKLWCWRRLLKVPWTARRSNLSILREINPEYSLEGLMLKLKLQYFGHLMQTADSLEKSLTLGKIEGRRRGRQKKRTSEETAGGHHRCNGHELGKTLGDGEGQGGLACCSPWGHNGYDWATERQPQQWICNFRHILSSTSVGP